MPHSRAQARFNAVSHAGSRTARKFERTTGTDGAPMRISEFFGCNTFGFELMEKKLPAADVDVLKEWAVSSQKLTPELANKVATAVKDWALSRGATHYCHWFHPQTGSTAEKHDSFFSFDKNGEAIEQFTGQQLIQAEPDASSFPVGGVRSTFEARGYTAWDASSPMFLMEAENGLTLCIPSVFISYSGEALDNKTPLLRSIKTVSDAALAALKLLDEDAKFVTATAGPEQEYFIVDEKLFTLRPDLVSTGRTVIGRPPAKHQQLDDHYFGAIKPRALNFIIECEQELYKLGVPCKTRHNEVAPAQYETAPIFENANVAADHNQVVMEVIKSIARRHGFVALFHEKPFADVNGSGKHLNWSLANSEGQNLLEPGHVPHENVRFLYFLSATVKAVHDHGDLLRMSVAHPGNDFRLGANEAPPAIMSVFLGETLTEVINNLTSGGDLSDRDNKIDLDLARVPIIQRDNTDRNRTSPFAFTGNKFEFRALGSSQSISWPLTILNSAVTNALLTMNKSLQSEIDSGKTPDQAALAVAVSAFKESAAVRFEGDNYSQAWEDEAAKRGLPNCRTTPEALKALKESKNQSFLAELKVLASHESDARYNVLLERYNLIRMIEFETMSDIVSTHVIPAAINYQLQVAEAIDACKDTIKKKPEAMTRAFQQISELTESLTEAHFKFRDFITQCESNHDEDAIGASIAAEGMQLSETVRNLCNELESVTDDDQWSLPKFREMLNII